MAYNYDPNLDPDKKDDQAVQDAPSLASGSQQTGGAGGLSGGSSVSSGKPTSSGDYQNLNSYLDANKGSDFGNKFTGKVQDDVNNASAMQGAAANEFKGASDAGSVKYNGGLVNSAVSDPYGFSQDQNNITAFQNMAYGKYKGPQSYQDAPSAYQKASGATQKAQDVSQAAQTEPGRFALLNNYFGTPDYTQGQKSLDNLLIQGNDSTQGNIKNARDAASQAQMNFQKQGPDLQNYAAGNIATSADNASKAKTSLSSAEKASRDNISQVYQNAKSSYDTDVTGAKQKLSSLNLGPDLLSKYGLTAGTQTYGVDPSQFFSASAAPTMQTAIDPTLAKKYDAYTKILGETNDFLDPSTVTGGYTQNPTFDKAGFNSAINTNKTHYGDAFADATRDFGNQPFIGSTSYYQNGLYNNGQGPLGASRGYGLDGYFNARNVDQEEQIFNKLYGPANSEYTRTTPMTASEQAYVDKINQIRNQYGHDKKLS